MFNDRYEDILINGDYADSMTSIIFKVQWFVARTDIVKSILQISYPLTKSNLYYGLRYFRVRYRFCKF